MVGSSGELLRAQIKSARYYAAPDVALRDIDLSIMPGEFVVVTGPAASGKSTLCYCLTGVIPHSISADLEGDVVVEGHRLRDLRLPEVAPLLGFVMQAPENQLFNLSVREDVTGIFFTGMSPDGRLAQLSTGRLLPSAVLIIGGVLIAATGPRRR